MPAKVFSSLLLGAVLAASGAEAAVISYQATNVSGNTWRYDYTVTNNGAITSTIELFDILFDPALYNEASLAIVSGPGIASGWDQLILASGVAVPAAYDVLATGSGIGNGQSVSGFAVSFTWLGADPPGPVSQDFEIYDPVTFDSLGTGTTSSCSCARIILADGNQPAGRGPAGATQETRLRRSPSATPARGHLH